jgi:protein TonB
VHAAVALAGWLFVNVYFPPKEEVILPQAPQLFDISIVPLSALETVLPQGAPVEKKMEAPPIPKEEPPVKEKPQPPEVVVTKKKIEKPKAVKEKPEHRSSAEPQATSLAPVRDGADAPSTNQPPGFVNGTGPSNEKARLNYQEAVAMILARAKRYPERALRRGVTGEATIRIEILSDGSLSDFEILRSAGASVLDEELRAMVDRAAPFPSFPGDLKRPFLALVVPVAFTIK